MRGRGRPALYRGLNALFDMLVPPPVWRILRSQEEVVLVPGHLLHRLPFEALVAYRE